MQGYLGNLGSADQQNLWTNFLSANQLSSNPSDTDPAKLQLFSNYVKGIYSIVNPTGVRLTEKTQIVLTIFDILQTLMSSMQGTQQSMQQTLTFLAQKGVSYTNLMKQIPVYIGSSPPGSTPPSGVTANANPALYTFGYANASLSMQNVLQYLDSTVASTGQPISFDLANSTKDITFNYTSGLGDTYTATLPGNSYIHMTATPTGTPGQYTFAVSVFESQGTKNSNFDPILQTVQVGPTLSTTISTTDKIEQRIASAASIFWQAFQSYPAFANDPPNIPWATIYPSGQAAGSKGFDIRYTYTGSDNSLALAASTAVQTRQQKNRLLQTAFEGLKAKRDALSDTSDQQQRVIDASAQGRSQTIKIYDTVLQNLKNIMNSIFP